jgi:hypothetical protein
VGGLSGFLRRGRGGKLITKKIKNNGLQRFSAY